MTWHLGDLVLFQESQTHAHHLYVIQTQKRDELSAHLKEDGIASGIHYPVPLHLQPAYQCLNYKQGDLPITESVCQNILSLPMFPELTEEDCVRIIESVQRFPSSKMFSSLGLS